MRSRSRSIVSLKRAEFSLAAGCSNLVLAVLDVVGEAEERSHLLGVKAL
jgi:hypothetical protein